MKKVAIFLFLIVSQSNFAQEVKKVLLIGIDGCRPDALEQAHTPHLDALIANGIYSPDALNDDITISGPGWSAVLCGVESPKHLVTDNDFSGNNYDSYPSLIKRLEEYNPLLNTYSICSWAPINDNIIQDFADLVVNVDTDEEVAIQGANYLVNNNPDFSFIYFDGVDDAGHQEGFSPFVTAYITAIEVVDGYVGTIIEAIESRATYNEEDWLIMVTTDHGGIGTSHGGNSIEEQNVFLIASANSIGSEVILKECVNMVDTTFNCLDDTTALTFSGNGDRVQVNPASLLEFGADQDFTVECRVRTQVSADVAIVGNKNWASGYNPGFVFSFAYPNGPEWKVNVSDGIERVDINTGGEIADDEWHTLSVTFDRDDLMKMYEDGAFVASADISILGNIDSGAGFAFGADIFGAYAYSGAIAEIRVWDAVLEEETINTWQCDTLSDNHPNYDKLIGYWRMDEGAGSTICQDRSPFGNNGSILGAQWASLDSITVCDYGNTPRLTDVFPTSFAHLCIPLEESWELDGNSLLPTCIPVSVEDIAHEQEAGFSFWPNPASDQIIIHQKPKPFPDTYIDLYDLTGKLLLRELVNSQDFVLDISNLSKGIYHLRIGQENRAIDHQTLVKED